MHENNDMFYDYDYSPDSWRMLVIPTLIFVAMFWMFYQICNLPDAEYYDEPAQCETL